MTLVTVKHLRRAGMCGRGARPWFAANNLSWTDFIEHGIDAEIVRATGDALALKVIAVAEQDKSDG